MKAWMKLEGNLAALFNTEYSAGLQSQRGGSGFHEQKEHIEEPRSICCVSNCDERQDSEEKTN